MNTNTGPKAGFAIRPEDAVHPRDWERQKTQETYDIFWSGKYHSIRESTYRELTRRGLVRDMVDPGGEYQSLQNDAAFKLMRDLEMAAKIAFTDDGRFLGTD